MLVIDLLQMSFTNIMRRKVRTILTVLGVVVGAASIVVMLSLGLGLKKNSMEQIERYGGLTTITVYPNGEQTDNTGQKKEAQKLDDKTVQAVSKIPHVEFVSPVLQADVLAKCGRYQANFSVKGMTEESMRKMNLEVKKGRLPSTENGLEFLFGNQILNSFYDQKGNGDAAKIDLNKDIIFYIFDTEAYYQNQNGTQNQQEQDDAKRLPRAKKYLIPVCGLLAGEAEEYNNNSYEVYTELEALKAHIRKIFKKRAIPGQPVRKNGKPYKEIYYNSLYVRADKMDNMEEIQKTIGDMGFEVISNAEWLKQTTEQMKTIQLALGGIGAVSFFVAALGIANTMMMSIYERTKEIGILKVLGCDLGDIRMMFLLEAGFIGLGGGVLGVGISYGISVVINEFAKDSSYQGISYIPFWLGGAAIIFSVLVGMLAGLLPAVRAMGLSPLSALRNE